MIVLGPVISGLKVNFPLHVSRSTEAVKTPGLLIIEDSMICTHVEVVIVGIYNTFTFLKTWSKENYR